jgi:hypothetical protein
MKFFIAPIALISIFALSACGGDTETNASVEHAAASSQTYTLCVKNDSSRSFTQRLLILPVEMFTSQCGSAGSQQIP